MESCNRGLYVRGLYVMKKKYIAETMFDWEVFLPLDLVFGQAEPNQSTAYTFNLYVSEWNAGTPVCPPAS